MNFVLGGSNDPTIETHFLARKPAGIAFMFDPDRPGNLHRRVFPNLDLPGFLMSILNILILALLAALTGFLRKGRGLALLFISALAVYWLGTRFDNDNFTFWIPTGTIVIAVVSWALTAKPERRVSRSNLPGFAILAGASLLVALNRYFQFEQFFSTLTPRLSYVMIFWLVFLAGLIGIGFLWRGERGQRWLIILAAIGVISVLVLLKSPMLAGMLYGFLKSLRSGAEEVIPFSIQWLGFSYVAFRLLHTFFDRLSGRLPDVSLDEYVVYIIFFPSFSAGPIDRIEHFLKDLRNPHIVDRQEWLEAGQRFFVGLFKKFVLADALALISINAFAPSIHTTGWAWLVLYAYAFRLLFDFSGYTDIAVGMGLMAGIRLPENFNSPYLKPNLTQFWNSWHMSLTHWFRVYFFNPLVRALRSAQKPLPVWVIIAAAQFGTMIFIGLWHGISINFVLWALWHAVGLFIHNRWSEAIRTRVDAWANNPGWKAFLRVTGILVTFHYVALGWVFFALVTPAQSWQFFMKLFAIS
jgi:alginate O-acetyltransferase complex protein AlgI